MPLILNLETATDVCSICVSSGLKILSSREAEQSNDHAKVITCLIETVLKEAGKTLSELDAVAVSVGPGSYTSLRVGASTAKGLCYATAKPLIAVPTLKSLALASQKCALPNSLYCPMIDARRMEVFNMIFNDNLEVMEPLTSMVVCESSFRTYFDAQKTIIFAGNGSTKCKALFDSTFAIFCDVFCSSMHLVPLAVESYRRQDFANLAYFSPLYFKPPNITTPKKSNAQNT
jgi:tRNA threonylcarbamoyladenosine biosynthesis protein TsaB